MFWLLVPDYNVIKGEQFLSPFFELVSCKPKLFNSEFEGEWGGRRGAEDRHQEKNGVYYVHGGNKLWFLLPFLAEMNFWRTVLCASCCWAGISCITVTPVSVAEHWFLYRELSGKKKTRQHSMTKTSTGGGATASLAPSGFECVCPCLWVCVKGGEDIPWLFSESIKKPTCRVKVE